MVQQVQHYLDPVVQGVLEGLEDRVQVVLVDQQLKVKQEHLVVLVALVVHVVLVLHVVLFFHLFRLIH
jgi:hypothetical protein